MRCFAKLWGILFLLATCSQQANAQILLEFKETMAGGIRVIGTGSGSATNFAISSNWQILDFDNDFISDSVGHFNLINADTVTGTISNSWGVSRSITGFSINRSATSNDDVAFTTNSNMFFLTNQPYTLSFEAIFNPSTLVPDDLIKGQYVDNTASGGTEIFGTTNLRVCVPEPASTGVFSSAGVILLLFTIRRRRKTKSDRAQHKVQSE